ncbi:hypothetical protein ACHQM5_001524 [Ranunculus cassubicifolius]
METLNPPHNISSNSIKAESNFRISNPFALKVGQVFTGFGIGCGVGIGVGRPLNLGAIPVLQQVTTAARGATDAFSGVGRHVNSSLRKMGAKNIEMGLGCGVGFGHGFGVGLAIKPGVIHQLQSYLGQAMVKVMMRFGAVPSLSAGRSFLPESFKSSTTTRNEISMKDPLGNIVPLASKVSGITSQVHSRDGNFDMGSTYESFASQKFPLDTSFGSRTEKVISGFLQSPLLKDEADIHLNDKAGHLRSENSVLQMVLKHQQLIETLTEENEKLRQILVEELKVPPSKLQGGRTSSPKSHTPCSDCFECRRRNRKAR